MSAYIVYGGEKIPLRRLIKRLPTPVFMSALHVEVCRRLVDGMVDEMAEEDGVDSQLQPLLTNLVFNKSSDAKGLTALITLIRSGDLPPVALYADFIDSRFDDLLGDAVERHRNSPRSALVDLRYLLRFVIKVLLHRVFRLIAGRLAPADTVICAYTDISERLYPEDAPTAGWLIYPYAPSIFRGLAYQRRGRREGRNFALAGMPYRFSDILRVLCFFRQRDTVLAQIERRVFNEHADELLALQAKKLCTCDEYEAAAYILHDKLLAAGIETHNACHGIATYGPYVSAGHFVFFNAAQHAFYSLHGRFSSHRIVAPAAALDAPPSEAGELCVVYVQGNWIASSKPYEYRFDQHLRAALAAACRELDVDCYIRAHPNLSQRRRQQIESENGLKMMGDWSGLYGRPVVFVNFLSSAFYDFRQRGPTLFVGDSVLDPQLLFGSGCGVVSLESLQPSLAQFKNGLYRQKVQREQLEFVTGSPAL